MLPHYGKDIDGMTIIDGNNLLWALHQSLGEREITNEIELCRVLSKYFAQIDEIGQVVFDGAGPSDTSEFEAISNPEVFFAGFHHDADSVIEEKITVNTSPRRLTIVSSDRRLRKAASARHAAAVKSEEFWERVRRELNRKTPRRKEPEAKREGLSDSETDKWLEVFGLEE
jgi:predicted RNA-binding protein with PIN domain